MLGNWDYIVIVIYLIFTMSIGFVCRKVAHNASDFFRGGGSMMWWMTGLAGIAAGLSAWTFTAAATRVYETGFFMVYLYWIWFPAYLIIYFFLARRYRQMRVMTVAEGIRRRYGRFTEQFWIWVQIPANMMIGAMWLLTVSIFISAATDVPVQACILVLGFVVGCVSIGAGAWSVIISDVVQMIIIITATITVLIRSLMLPEIGGVGGLMEKIPDQFTDFSIVESPNVWIAFLVVSSLMRVMQASDLSQEGAKFLAVKDGKSAKKSALVLACGSLIIPIVAFLPVMACSILYPDLSAIFPNMENPTEGSYMAIATHVLPTGMVGLIVCAMFAASISSMDAALNRNAGFCVRNFYIQFIKKDASEKDQLLAGRVFTVALALLLITLALMVANNRELKLFELSNKVFSLVIPPMVVPAVFGFVYKRTPIWSGWSTVVVGFLAAFSANRYLETMNGLEWVSENIWGLSSMNSMESGDILFIATTAATLICSITWFFFTSIFYKKVTPEHKAAIEDLYKDMRTPIDHVAEKSEDRDAIQFKIVGALCVFLGSLLMFGVLIPNSPSERMVFIYCGGAIAIVGGILLSLYRRKMRQFAS